MAFAVAVITWRWMDGWIYGWTQSLVGKAEMKSRDTERKPEVVVVVAPRGTTERRWRAVSGP